MWILSLQINLYQSTLKNKLDVQGASTSSWSNLSFLLTNDSKLPTMQSIYSAPIPYALILQSFILLKTILQESLGNFYVCSKK